MRRGLRKGRGGRSVPTCLCLGRSIRYSRRLLGGRGGVGVLHLVWGVKDAPPSSASPPLMLQGQTQQGRGERMETGPGENAALLQPAEGTAEGTGGKEGAAE